jgi:Domain of unknown function (DUF4136)
MKSVPASIAALCLALPLLAATGCASRPDIRLDKNPSVEMTSFRTFGFYDPVSTDKSLYTTILSGRLKKATREELERRNYVYNEQNPELKVNFALSVVDRQELRSMPTGGFWGARFGLEDLETVNYRQGTLMVDLVDSGKNELVWRGVAEGRLDRKSVENPGPAVDKVVGELFTGFPLNLNDGQLASVSTTVQRQ